MTATTAQVRQRHIASVVAYLHLDHPNLSAQLLTRLATEAVDLMSDCPTPDFIPYLARRAASEAAVFQYPTSGKVIPFPARPPV